MKRTRCRGRGSPEAGAAPSARRTARRPATRLFAPGALWLSACATYTAAAPPPAPPSERHPCSLVGEVTGTAREQLQPLYAGQSGYLVVVGSVAFLCPCGGYRLGGAGEDSRLAGAGEDSRVAGAGEETRIAGAGEDSRVAGAGETSRVAGAAEDSRIAGAGEQSQLAGASEDSRVAGAGETSRVAGSGERSRVAGAGEDSRIAGASSPMICEAISHDPGLRVDVRRGLQVVIYDGIEPRRYASEDIRIID